MPESYKRLGAIAPADDKEYLVYTTPGSTQSLVSNITVTNRSSSSATFDINVHRPTFTEYTPTGSTVRIEVGQDGLIQMRDSYDFNAGGNSLGFYYNGSVPQSHIDAVLGVQSGDNITVFNGTTTYTFTATGAGLIGNVADLVIPGGTGVGGYMSDNGDYADIAGQTGTTYNAITQQSDLDDVGGQPYSSPSFTNLYKTSQISANETLILEPGIALSASASIVAKDNSGGNLTISTYGVELS